MAEIKIKTPEEQKKHNNKLVFMGIAIGVGLTLAFGMLGYLQLDKKGYRVTKVWD